MHSLLEMALGRDVHYLLWSDDVTGPGAFMHMVFDPMGKGFGFITDRGGKKEDIGAFI